MFVGVLEVAGCLGNGRVPLADGFKCEEVILWCHPLCQIRYNDEAYDHRRACREANDGLSSTVDDQRVYVYVTWSMLFQRGLEVT